MPAARWFTESFTVTIHFGVNRPPDRARWIVVHGFKLIPIEFLLRLMCEVVTGARRACPFRLRGALALK